MKKNLFIFVAALFLFTCNSNTDKTVENAKSTAQEYLHSVTLTLNNGAKWKADSITNHHVVNLKTDTGNFRIKPFPTAAEHELLSTDLSSSLN